MERMLEVFDEHMKFMLEHGLYEEKRCRQVGSEIRFIVESRMQRRTFGAPDFHDRVNELAGKVGAGEIDTYTAADIIMTELLQRLNAEQR